MITIDTDEGIKSPQPYMRRGGLVLGAALIFMLISVWVGARHGLIFAVGLGFGVVLEGLGFGFSGPWRAMIVRRDPLRNFGPTFVHRPRGNLGSAAD